MSNKISISELCRLLSLHPEKVAVVAFANDLLEKQDIAEWEHSGQTYYVRYIYTPDGDWL